MQQSDFYAPPHKRVHPFAIANHLVRGSYVSLQMALAHYHLIPEHVAVVTSVTTGEAATFTNEFGTFNYKQLPAALFYGFEYRLLAGGAYGFVATPEKALLDLLYLHPEQRGANPAYIESLRLQNLDDFDVGRFAQWAAQVALPQWEQAVWAVRSVKQELMEYEPL